MPQTRRQLAWALIAAPMALALAKANVADAQDMPFGGLEDPGNVFISPCGRPFRAKPDDPYPVVDWFNMADADGDGKLDHAEFIADTIAFFKILDRNSDGVISPAELAFYEQRVAPEVLGMRVKTSGAGIFEARPVLQTVQGYPGGMGGGGMGGMGSVDPGGGAPAEPSDKARPYDASGSGASPYGFFDEPEPVAAADVHYRGIISKADFVRLADIHFSALDRKGLGYLTLDSLPITPVQRRLQRVRGRRHR